MASTAEMRAWLRDEGHDVPDRGRLSPALIQLFEDGQDNAVDIDLPDADVIDIGLPDEPEPERTVDPEVRPSRTRAKQSASTRSQSFLSRMLAGDDKGKPGTKKPARKQGRVSLEKLVTRGYQMAGRILTPISPAASMCLRVQAPMAGVMLNDIATGTVMDRILQPAARAEQKLDVVFALTVPPLACMGLEMTGGMEPTPDVLFRRGILQQMLRESLRTGLELSEKYGEQIAASVQREAKYDSEVDSRISVIFGIVPATTEQPEPEMAAA